MCVSGWWERRGDFSCLMQCRGHYVALPDVSGLTLLTAVLFVRFVKRRLESALSAAPRSFGRDKLILWKVSASLSASAQLSARERYIFRLGPVDAAYLCS